MKFALKAMGALCLLSIGSVGFTAGPEGTYNAAGAALAAVSISSIPEPATWAMMLIGFGAVGSSIRRRRTTLAVTYA